MNVNENHELSECDLEQVAAGKARINSTLDAWKQTALDAQNTLKDLKKKYGGARAGRRS